MPRLVPVKAKDLIKILERLGFIELRVKGSHHLFMEPGTKKTTTVPVHGGEDVSVGLLRQILRDIELSVQDYEKLRKKKK